MFIDNNLFNLAFQKAGYDSAFLGNVRRNYYDGFLRDESKLVDFLFSEYRNTDKLLVIMPDFDVDGISSWMILYSGLSLLGLNVEVYVPDSKAGYGIRPADIDNVISLYPNLSGIITCDVGITAVEAVSYFKKLLPDKDFLITDHHNENSNGDDIKKYADIVVDPCRLDENYEFTSVCGAFVAYHIVMNLAKKIGDPMLIELTEKLNVFVMLGSLGDTMTMHHDTLNICQAGINNYRNLINSVDGDFSLFYNSDDFIYDFGLSNNINSSAYKYDDLPLKYRLPFEGLYSMCLYLKSNQTVTADTFIDFKFVSFTIVPMLNTPKRLEKPMQLIYDCFCVNYDTFSSYYNLFAELDALNTQRKEMVASVMARIDNFRCPESPYMYDITELHIPGGAYGLIATKLLALGMPFVFVGSRSDGSFNGSGRVCSMINGSAINTPHITINGHDNAFGFDLPYENINGYASFLDDVYKAFVDEINKRREDISYDPYENVVHVGFDENRVSDFDYLFTKDSIDECYDYAFDIMQLDCFSKGFEKPQFVLDFDKSDVDSIKIIGKKGTTLKIVFKTGLELIMFGGNAYLEAYEQGQVNQLIGCFDLNRFRGSYSVQFKAEGIF